MPELPEVETIRRGLEPRVAGRAIEAVRIHAGAERLAITHSPRELEDELAGLRIEALGRHGKYLIAALDDERCWVLHLRMTGVLLIGDRSAPQERFERARIDLDDGCTLRFNDIRKFGTWHLVEDPAEAMPRIGPDALSGEFSVRWLRDALGRRSVAVKSALLDQRVAAGVGNIYADEALWIAGVDPRAAANSIGPRRVARLHAALLETLREGLADGGSSFDEYRDAFGLTGGHHLRVHVFRREGEPCERARCRGREIRKIRIGGRATHFCTGCQRR
ncbi:MAG: bifunctional DNA-formamidopyrimidine glycosylase/DNA-(apurinic or apyrimidinic site) lyase [Chloroflexi bacterium]|nr:bifunctional DNA-formamidopyrimidine glycosylase/DNA-(apurinic or apyrimidinic site) lyase [Chloroflexota bacterium]